MERLTKTGLLIPDRVPWGTHLCQFYETTSDLLEVLVPYFKEGLTANESCIWITFDPLCVEEAKDALRAAVPELDQCLATGQMEIVPHDRWYLADGTFDAEAVLKACCEKAEDALEKGYAGLRASGNVACLHDARWAELTAYEEMLQAAIHSHNVIALCSYPLHKCSASQFLQAVDVHDFALVRRNGRWKCVESKGSSQLLNRLSVKEHALASSISPIVMMDLAGNVTYVNSAALKAWQFGDESQVLNRPALDFWQDPDEVLAHMAKVQASGQYVGELVAKCKDDSTFDAEVLGSLTLDDGGQPIGMVASCLDVTARKAAESLLRESEERHRTLVENVELGIVLINRQHKIIAINGAHAQRIGRSVDNCVGQECFRVFEKRETVCPHCPGTRAMAMSKPANVETEGRRDDGSTFAARVQAFPVIASDGGVEGFIEVVEDITDRKHEQDSLRRASFCIEQAGDSIFWIDSEGRIAFANQKVSEELGYSSEELQAMTVFDVDPRFTPESWGPHWEAIRRKKSFVLESCHRTKSGTVFPVEIGVNYMMFDGKEYNCAFARDISERRKAERQLAHFSAIVNSSQDAIVGATLEGIITSWNLGAERLFGYTADEMIGQPISKLLPADRPDETSVLLARLKAGGRIERYDTIRLRKNGTLVDVSVTLSPVRDNDGEVVGVSAITHEITDRKRAEEALRVSEEQYRALIDTIPNGVCVCDPEGKIVLFVTSPR